MSAQELALTPPPRDERDEPGMVKMMERLALNPDLPVEKLEKLLEMQLRVRELEAREAYAAALSRLQPNLPVIQERGEVAGRYKYALWEDVISVITPLLASEGFSLSFRTSSTVDSVTVTGVLTHSKGHHEETSLTLPLDSSGNKAPVQAIGSSTSYGKRYTAGALLNLRMGETDDDGGKPVERINEAQIAHVEQLIAETKSNLPQFLKWAKVKSLEEIPAKSYETVVKQLEAKKGRAK